MSKTEKNQNENAEELLSEIDQFLDNIKTVPPTTNYWLIRTQGGTLYDSFKQYGFVAIGHEKISLFEAKKAIDGKNKKTAIDDLKDLAEKKYPDEKPGIVAGQVYKFISEVEKGDIVIIPSANSSVISIGIVSDSKIPSLTSDEINKTDCDYTKRKPVRWIKDIPRSELDPYMYKMFQAHQAINDVTHYAEIIERTISNFYQLNGETNLVLEIEQEDDINARQLFNMGHYIFQYTDDFIAAYKLPITTDDIELKVNLNSKGRIQLKSPKGNVLWLMAILTIAVNGGGLKLKMPNFDFDLSTDGIIKNIINYQNQKNDRKILGNLVDSMGSVKMLPPSDVLKTLKQVSTNKDIPK